MSLYIKNYNVAILFSETWASDNCSWLVAQMAATGDTNHAVVLKAGPSR